MGTLSDKIGFYKSGCIDWWTLYTEQTDTKFKIRKDGDDDIKVKDVKDFIRWVETEIIMRCPDRRINLIKLKNRVGDKLI